MSNPFDELGLDPRTKPRQLTALLRRRAERAALPEERQRLQALWRELTLREEDRLRHALLAHPRTRSAQALSIEALAAKVPGERGRAELAPLWVEPEELVVMPEPEVGQRGARLWPPAPEAPKRSGEHGDG